MREELIIGARVIHNGIAKVIDEIHGDVIILNDKSVVRSSDISIEASQPEETEPQEPANEEFENAQATVKIELRRHIEELNEDSPAIAVFALIQEVDPSITIATLEAMTVAAMQKKLLHIAVTTGKINRKRCGECGQTVPE